MRGAATAVCNSLICCVAAESVEFNVAAGTGSECVSVGSVCKGEQAVKQKKDKSTAANIATLVFNSTPFPPAAKLL